MTSESIRILTGLQVESQETILSAFDVRCCIIKDEIFRQKFTRPLSIFRPLEICHIKIRVTRLATILQFSHQDHSTTAFNSTPKTPRSWTWNQCTLKPNSPQTQNENQQMSPLLKSSQVTFTNFDVESVLFALSQFPLRPQE